MFFEVVLLDITLLSAIFPHIDRKEILNGKFDFHMLLFVLWCLSKIIYIIYKNNNLKKYYKLICDGNLAEWLTRCPAKALPKWARRFESCSCRT